MARNDSYGSPTGFTGFDDYFNANAEGAKASAGRVAKDVDEAGQAAEEGLKAEEGTFKQGVDKAATESAASGQPYGGPTGMDPSAALQAHYQVARDKRNALGNAYGVQASLGQKASGLDALLTQRGSGNNFDALRQRYAGLESGLGAARQNAQAYAAQAPIDAQRAADARYQQQVAGARQAALDMWRRQQAEEGPRRANPDSELQHIPDEAADPGDDVLRPYIEMLVGQRYRTPQGG